MTAALVAIAVAAVDYGRSGGQEWPWRLALLDAPAPLPALDITLDQGGLIDGVHFYCDEARIERAIALRFGDGRETWLDSAGGDFVRASLTPPSDLPRWGTSRLYP